MVNFFYISDKCPRRGREGKNLCTADPWPENLLSTIVNPKKIFFSFSFIAKYGGVCGIFYLIFLIDSQSVSSFLFTQLILLYLSTLNKKDKTHRNESTR